MPTTEKAKPAAGELIVEKRQPNVAPKPAGY